MTLRLYKATTAIPKYSSGDWHWNDKSETFEFKPTAIKTLPDCALPAPQLKFGIQFKDYMDEIDENIFRETFRRPEWSRDSDVITIQDIKDVALFSAPPNSYTKKIVDFVHTETVDQFLNDLIIYFEYFLKLVEFLLIRRDEVREKLLDTRSVQIEKMLSAYLVQYRLVLAREYSKIVMGSAGYGRDVAAFHHLANKSKRSKTEKDSTFFETFICLCTRVVWIAMHRKSYAVIDCEINRLLRTDHFNVALKQLPECLRYSIREQQVLFGPNNAMCNYRNQRSPLILEILNIASKDTDVLWINENKYRGTDKRMFKLEMEYVTADGQLNLFDCHHGILGNPKSMYNTMLALDGHAVRKEKFSKDYDPFQLVRMPVLEIPDWKEFNKVHEKNEPYFRVISKKFEPDVVELQKSKWKRRAAIITGTDTASKVNRNILQQCANEIKALDTPIVIDRDAIMTRFYQERDRKMKRMPNQSGAELV